MRLRLRSFLLTSALTFAPAVASATTISGLYVDGGAGYNLVQDQHVHANSPYANSPAVQKFSVNHGTGFTGFGAVGWGFGNGLRVEAEGLYNFSHDDYTSEANALGYTNNPAHAIGFNSFYKTLPDSQKIPCTSADLTPEDKAQGVQPFWNDSNSEKFWGTGNPATNNSGGYTVTPSNTWPYVPANLCFLAPSHGYGDRWNEQLGGAANNPEQWLDGSPNNTMYFPGTYYYQANNNNNTFPAFNYPYGITVQPGHPLYLARIERLVNHQGTDESFGGFANVLYDFDLERLFGVKSIVTPFVGGGAGYLWQRYNRPNTMIAAITGTHGGFSWQGIAGVAFDTGIAGLQVVAQYRMIGQPGSFYNGSFNYGTEGGHANFDQRFNHQFIVGFRYAFHNQPIHHIQPPAVRPIVAAAPAPVPARSYLVFFDWNQYALTSRARQIVVEAAHATSYVHTTRINVNGYTDSSAAPGLAGQKYNYALSVKRARSVEAELIRNGVPASEIVIRGYGDTNPLVPTGPNTREPQNRRVEIILHA